MKNLCLLLALMMALSILPLPVLGEGAVYSSGDYRYTLLPGGGAEITRYSGKETDLIIPAQLDGHPVISIGKTAFALCSSAISITVPEGVECIAERAFDNCKHLVSIRFPDSIREMGCNPLLQCSELTEIIVSDTHPYLQVRDGVLYSKPDRRLICYPEGLKVRSSYTVPEGIKEIGQYGFCRCSQLTQITLPDGLEIIGADAFSGCYRMQTLRIPDSVVSMADNPFSGCEVLKKLIISDNHPFLELIDHVLFSKPDHRLIHYPQWLNQQSYTVPAGTRIIDETAFFDCDKLQVIILPEGLEAIGKQAFAYCDALTHITLPHSLKTIEWGAFRFCDTLSSVEIPDGVEAIDKTAFDECPLLTLKVAQNSYAHQWAKENGLNYVFFGIAFD